MRTHVADYLRRPAPFVHAGQPPPHAVLDWARACLRAEWCESGHWELEAEVPASLNRVTLRPSRAAPGLA